eukprot:1228312-Pleurochrysis_carterae.AAC.1
MLFSCLLSTYSRVPIRSLPSPWHCTEESDTHLLLTEMCLAMLNFRGKGVAMGGPTFDVEVSEVEEHFDVIFNSYFQAAGDGAGAPDAGGGGGGGEKDAANAGSYTILVLNPNKSDMVDIA